MSHKGSMLKNSLQLLWLKIQSSASVPEGHKELPSLHVLLSMKAQGEKQSKHIKFRSFVNKMVSHNVG